MKGHFAKDYLFQQIYIVGDRIGGKRKRRVIYEEAQEVARENLVEYCEIDSETGFNIREAIEKIITD